jgi:hypothetical protein
MYGEILEVFAPYCSDPIYQVQPLHIPIKTKYIETVSNTRIIGIDPIRTLKYAKK